MLNHDFLDLCIFELVLLHNLMIHPQYLFLFVFHNIFLLSFILKKKHTIHFYYIPKFDEFSSESSFSSLSGLIDGTVGDIKN